jgi:hypothetical protein
VVAIQRRLGAAVHSAFAAIWLMSNPLAAHAGPAASLRQVRCPKIVGNARTGLFYPGRDLQCFNNSKLAGAAGYVSASKGRSSPIDGWWRATLQSGKDTCQELRPASYTTTIFLQLAERSQAIVSMLCPGEELLQGQPISGMNGYRLVADRQIENLTECKGAATMHYEVTMNRVTPDAEAALQVTYRVQRTCSPSAGGASCESEWRGIANREAPNHTFWPEIPSSTDEFKGACSTALSRCSKCHPGIDSQ